MRKTDYHDIRQKPYVKPRPRILRPQNKMKTWRTIETWGFQKTLSKRFTKDDEKQKFLKRMFPLSMNEKFMVKNEGALPAEVDHIAGGIGHAKPSGRSVPPFFRHRWDFF